MNTYLYDLVYIHLHPGTITISRETISGEGGPLEARLLQLPGPLAKPTVGRYCTAPLALAASWAWESEDDGSENGKHKGFGWFLGCKSGAKATVNYGS